jgi:putative Mg2+ transporter-C (MgtC) family protein
VVTGIGFLGAGTIIQARGSVQGLTTAAVIWVAAGIGMCAGLGLIVLALGFTGLVLLALVAMDPIRERLSQLGTAYEIDVVAPDDSLAVNRILYVLEGHDIHREGVRMERTDENELNIHCIYHGYGGAALRILEALSQIEGVHGRRVDSRRYL